jgi:hypothetical protein
MNIVTILAKEGSHGKLYQNIELNIETILRSMGYIFHKIEDDSGS